MTLLRQIQDDIADPKSDITDLLRKCKILAHRLGSSDFMEWVDSELDGYGPTRPVPDYRRLACNYFADFMDAGWSVPNQPILWEVLPKEARDALQFHEYRQGIAKTKPFLTKGTHARLDRPEIAIRLEGKMFPELHCMAVREIIPVGEFEQLVSAIKNRILDFVLKIEAENPSAGEAAPNSHPVPAEKLQPLVQNFFHGPVGNLAQNSERFSQASTVSVPREDLSRLVTELANHLNELALDTQQKRRAEAQIAALKVELEGTPDNSVVRQAGQTLRNVTEGAIASLLATAAQPTIWHWIQQILSKF